MAVEATDSNELAGFGYKQELDRSLGSFSSFAAGFSYISILTGVFQLFAFGFAFAGPAVWWTWPIVLIGQMSVALCFADNEPSWRLMERVGMRREQHTKQDSLHRDGQWLDGMMYALLADEWRATQPR